MNQDQELRLCQLNLAQLLYAENDFNGRLKRSLSSLSGGLLEAGGLQQLSNDARNVVYVLLDVSGSRGPKLLCACQVYLEGPIQQFPQQEAGKSIKECFPQFVNEFPPNLVGARIMHLFASETTQIGYGSKLLHLLTRFFEEKPIDSLEEGPLMNPQQGVHYFGIRHELNEMDVRQFDLWKLHFHFQVLYAGALRGSGVDMFNPSFSLIMVKSIGICNRRKMIALADASQAIFLRTLGMNPLDHTLALRIVKSYWDFLPQGSVSRSPWTKFQENRALSFTQHVQKYELVTDLVPDVAGVYFKKQLPMNFTELEENVVMLMVYSTRLSKTGDDFAKALIGGGVAEALQHAFAVALDHFSSLALDVED